MGKIKDLLGDDLFAMARRSDPIPSHLAARDANRRINADHRLVLLTHADYRNGLTDFELAHLCDRQQTSLGKRRGELRNAGFIEATPEKRPAPSGSAAIVWRITFAGLTLVRGLYANKP